MKMVFIIHKLLKGKSRLPKWDDCSFGNREHDIAGYSRLSIMFKRFVDEVVKHYV